MVSDRCLRYVRDRDASLVETGTEVVILAGDDGPLVETAELGSQRAANREVGCGKSSRSGCPFPMPSRRVGQSQRVERTEDFDRRLCGSSHHPAGDGTDGRVVVCGRQVEKPRRIGTAVGVRECNDFSSSGANAGIARGGGAFLGLLQDSNAASLGLCKRAQERQAFVRGPVVDEDNLARSGGQSVQCLEEKG